MADDCLFCRIIRGEIPAKLVYESPEVADLSTAEGNPLLTAIVTFDDKVKFELDPPASDHKQIMAGFLGVRSSSAGREMTFTAIKQALEKYLPMRTSERRELVLVIVTDEAGDDSICTLFFLDSPNTAQRVSEAFRAENIGAGPLYRHERSD